MGSELEVSHCSQAPWVLFESLELQTCKGRGPQPQILGRSFCLGHQTEMCVFLQLAMLTFLAGVCGIFLHPAGHSPCRRRNSALASLPGMGFSLPLLACRCERKFFTVRYDVPLPVLQSVRCRVKKSESLEIGVGAYRFYDRRCPLSRRALGVRNLPVIKLIISYRPLVFLFIQSRLS